MSSSQQRRKHLTMTRLGDKALNGRLDLREDGAERCINGVPMWQVELLPRGDQE